MAYFAKPDLVDTKGAAKILDVTVSALEAWRLQGKGPIYRKIGRLVRYVESDLLAYLDNCCRQSTSEYLTCKGSAFPSISVRPKENPLPSIGTLAIDPNKPRRGRPGSKLSAQASAEAEPLSQGNAVSSLPVTTEQPSPSIANERSQTPLEVKSPAVPVRSSRLVIIEPDMAQITLMAQRKAASSSAKTGLRSGNHKPQTKAMSSSWVHDALLEEKK